jgi:hypothetical protein
MSSSKYIIDELPVSTHRNFGTHRDFVTHVDGSSLTGERYVSAFIRTRSSGNNRIRLVDLTPVEQEDGRKWQDSYGRAIYLERPVPDIFANRNTRQYGDFINWIQQQRC